MRPKHQLINALIMTLGVMILLLVNKHQVSFGEVDAPDFDMLFEKHGAIMMMIEPESGKILYVNNAALDFYGYAHGAFTTLSINEINTLSSEEIAIEMKNAIEEKRNYFRFKHILSDGSIKDVEVYSYPFFHASTTFLNGSHLKDANATRLHGFSSCSS